VDEGVIADLTRKAIKDIGYEQDGFHWESAEIEVLLHGQSADIAQGVDAAGNKDEGAGDQGIMFGYACRETPGADAGPDLLRAQDPPRPDGSPEVRQGPAAVLGPDAKSQVTVNYEGGKPVGVTQIVLSTQHLDPDLSSEDVRGIVEPFIRKGPPGRAGSRPRPSGT
jgi:S-adenosylmethionine synthetase